MWRFLPEIIIPRDPGMAIAMAVSMLFILVIFSWMERRTNQSSEQKEAEGQ